MMERKLSSHFSLSREVSQALLSRAPIVAMESTVITHGLPKPENLQLARDLEEIVRAKAVPATIALLSGRIKVGLSAQELGKLAELENVHKISARDISIAVTSGWDGGTTVSGTLFAAYQAGIKVFATGGIGGVHRDGVNCDGAHRGGGQRKGGFDISADLQSLAHTPLIVVCSGAKIILDLPATREQLETLGVPVIGYQTSEFPAFFSASSGLPVDYRAEDASEIARIAKNHWQLGLNSAILVVNPPPIEDSIPRAELDAYVEEALADAESMHVSGSALTPFLLQQLNILSEGKTLKTNLTLLKNNARLASEIAQILQKDERFTRA